jgi:uncharacterized protein YndB with AHSA1/START domain
MTAPPGAERIHYPDKYRPDRTWVFVRNELDVAAPCHRVWAWLVRADRWPTWYSNSQDVELEHAASIAGLSLGTQFRWKTFGVRLRSVVEEFVPGERIAWTAKAFGVDAYHAWLLTPTATGCHVLTEETQNGWLAALSQFFMPNRMHNGHQMWLERLQEKAAREEPC